MKAKAIIKFLDRVIATRESFTGAVVALVSLIVLGGYLMTYPWQISGKRLEELSAQIEASNDQATSVAQRWEKIEAWYDPSYSERFYSLHTAALGKIKAAEVRLIDAESISSPDSVVAVVQEGMEDLEQVEEYLNSAFFYTSKAISDREAALSNLRAARKRFSELGDARVSAERAFQKEANYYPDERVDEYRKTILGSLGELKVVSGLLLYASRLLPGDEDETGVGDPSRVIALVRNANEKLDTQQKLLEQIDGWTAELNTARLTAKLELDDAREKIAEAEESIEKASHSRGYRSDGALVEALSQLQKARNHANTSQEELSKGSVDYISALENAKAAQAAADDSNNEVAAQIEADNESERLVSELQKEISAVTALNASTAINLQFLANTHSRNAWSNVSNNALVTGSVLTQAQLELIELRSERSNQKYKLAVKKGKSGLDKLGQARILIAAVADARRTLETARGSWPNAESNALSSIVNSRTTVSMYAGYSSRAVSKLARAESLLNAARSLAASKDYVPAVEKAREAAVEARTAKTQAYSDYEAEQERIRRARAEEERRRAAEAAAEAARQQDLRDMMDTTSSYDYGGSSGSGFGGSDYGSFGGGSSGSDYGSFGGSSGGSDYGSFP